MVKSCYCSWKSMHIQSTIDPLNWILFVCFGNGDKYICRNPQLVCIFFFCFFVATFIIRQSFVSMQHTIIYQIIIFKRFVLIFIVLFLVMRTKASAHNFKPPFFLSVCVFLALSLSFHFYLYLFHSTNLNLDTENGLCNQRA